MQYCLGTHRNGMVAPGETHRSGDVAADLDERVNSGGESCFRTPRKVRRIDAALTRGDEGEYCRVRL